MRILAPVNDNEDAIPLSEVASTPRYVDHGTNANVARPSGTRPVIWRGSVEPVNMINGDEWEQEGVSYQPSDADLTTIAALDSGVAGTLATDGAGWVKKTYAQFKTALGLVKADVGLSNVDNTSDAAKPVSTATQTALNLKANIASPTFTGTVGGITKSMVGLANVDNTSDAAKPISTATQTALDAKQASDTDLTAIAALDSATAGAIASDGAGWVKKTYAQFKTALGLVKADVGLSNVDNTSDAAKPVSTAQQTALNLKANIASPTFTGTVGGITKSMVGLGNVDNTADSAKPVSTAQQTALDAKLNLAGGTLTGNVNLDRYELQKPNISAYLEKYINFGNPSGAISLDLSLYNVFFVNTPTAAVTLNVTNPPAARSGDRIVSFTVAINFPTTLYAVTWPTGTSWGSAGAPTLALGVTWLTFWSHSPTAPVWYAMVSWVP